MKARRHPAGSFRRVRVLDSPSSRSRTTALAGAALLAAVAALLVFAPALGFDPVRDDRQLVFENDFMRSPGWLGKLLSSDFWGSAGGRSGLWRPLILLSYWVDGRMSGWSPAYFHGANLVAHAVASALVTLVIAGGGAGAWAAAAGGIAFAVMPLHVEPVAWIAGRTDLWAAALALAALALDRRAADDAAPARRLAAPAAFALALLCKESAAAALVPLLAQRVVLRGGRPVRAALVACWPFAAALAAWAFAHRAMSDAPAAARALAPADALATGLAAAAALLAKSWPGAMHGPDLAIAPVRGLSWLAAAGGALLAAGAAASAALAWRRNALATPVALAWAPLAALAALIAVQRAPLFGERHFYLGSAGVAWLLALVLERPGSRAAARPARAAAFAVAAVWIAWSAIAARGALAAWRNDATMYAEIARQQPQSATGSLGLALVALGRGADAEALAQLARAERADSTRFEGALYLGRIAIGRGDAEEALAQGRRAERLGGRGRDASLLQALALQRLGRYPEARAILAPLRASQPGDDDVRWAWGGQLEAEARYAEAAAEYGALTTRHPDDYEGWLALARASAGAGEPAAARAALERALALPPAADGRAAAMLARLSAAR